MAIVGLVLIPAPQQVEEARCALAAEEGVLEVQVSGEQRLAVVVECGSQHLTPYLEKLAALPSILELSVAFADFEEDMDEHGHMPCPPQRRKKRDNRG